tara:strand:+ start:673 stop:1890 length:1218 start_codon:yes stop_codon:yes gene_type:complete
MRMNKKGSIVFLSIRFPIEGDSDMYKDLMIELNNSGEKVFIICPNNKKAKKKYKFFDLEDKLRVFRIPINWINSKNLYVRGILELILPLSQLAILLYINFSSKINLIISSTPPITSVFAIAPIKLITKAKWNLILRDITPQNAVDLQLLRKYSPGWLILRSSEYLSYLFADRIGCMSPKNKSYIIKENKWISSLSKKIYMLENWLSVSQEADLTSKNSIDLKQSQDLNLLLAGTIGRAQPVEYLIEYFSKIKSRQSNIFLSIIGDGIKTKWLTKKIISDNLTNVKYFKKKKKEDYIIFAKKYDIGLVILDPRFTIPNIPSRIISYWASKLPVLIITNKSSDAYNYIIKPANAGWEINIDNYPESFTLIHQLAEKPKEYFKEMGFNGFCALKKLYNADIASKKILS